MPLVHSHSSLKTGPRLDSTQLPCDAGYVSTKTPEHSSAKAKKIKIVCGAKNSAGFKTQLPNPAPFAQRACHW